jgi:hypothetical protein
MRSSSPEDHLTARRVADDVGCYVQKVAKFGEKLEREKIIGREKVEELNKNIYYGPDAATEEEQDALLLRFTVVRVLAGRSKDAPDLYRRCKGFWVFGRENQVIVLGQVRFGLHSTFNFPATSSCGFFG